MSKKEYKTISARAKYLLNKSEGVDVDFKKELNGLHSEDLVAFANSPSGGAILIGVGENENSEGPQRGQIIGCSTSDADKLFILNKASQCIPQIEVKIVFENLSRNPFIRIEVPGGELKPYCTAKGTYKIRGDARNQTLTPNRLLDIYLDRESDSFLRRFQIATEALEKRQRHLLEQSIELDQKLQMTLEHAANSNELADLAAGMSEGALVLLEEVDQRLSLTFQDIDVLLERVNALLEHHNIEDPIKAKYRNLIRISLKGLYEEGLDEEEIVSQLHDQYMPRLFTWVEVEQLIREELESIRQSRTMGSQSSNP